MGSVYKRGNQWWICFMVHGRRIREAAGTTKRREAETFLNRRMTELRQARDPRFSFASLMVALSGMDNTGPLSLEFAEKLMDLGEPDLDFLGRMIDRVAGVVGRGAVHALLQDYAAEYRPIVTTGLTEAFEEYLRQPRRNRTSKVVLDRYRGQWRIFCAFAEEEGVSGIGEVSSELLASFMASIQEKKRSASTYNHYHKTISAAGQYFVRKAYWPSNLMDGIPRMMADTVHKRNLTAEELRTVLEKSEGWLHVLFLLGIYTGMRLKDCAFLRGSHVNLKAGTISVVPEKTKRQHKRLVVPLHPFLKEAIADHVKGSAYVLPEAVEEYERFPRAKGAALTGMIQTFLKKKCGIEIHELHEGRGRASVLVGFHSLRHSFVTLLAEAGVDEPTLIQLVGQGSPEVNRIYNHVTLTRKREAVGKLNLTGKK